MGLALVALSSGVALLGADLVLRLFADRFLYYRPHEMFVERWPDLPVVTRYERNVEYAGETHGDLAAMIGDQALRERRPIAFRTDAFGFRNGEEAGDRRAYDLIVLGDSFGVGNGTTQERTWVSLLGRRGLKAYNLSMPGAPWQHYVHLVSRIEGLPVHSGSLLLLALFSGNDLDDDYRERPVDLSRLPWSSPGERLGVRASTFLRRSPLRQLASRLGAGNGAAGEVLVRDFVDGRKVLFYRPYAARKERTAAMVRNHRQYGALLDAIRRINRVAGERRLRPAIVLFPSKEEVYEWVLAGAAPWTTEPAPSGLAAALGDFCRQNGLSFVDLKPALVRASREEFAASGQLLYWTDDTHWNERGHAVVGDLLYRHLVGESRESATGTAGEEAMLPKHLS